MVVCNHKIDFAAGALVIPRGKIKSNGHQMHAQCPRSDFLSTSDLGFRVGLFVELLWSLVFYWREI